ncbi:MAG: glycosyltransferase [Candidatus Magnetoovum sp. WYHC-5]|nr:glycosyltransferase [Candidatus Magnetoovum sp. WYHC-5]
MNIIYPVPEPLLDTKARFIQIVNTSFAVAMAGQSVKLIGGYQMGIDGGDINRFFNILPNPNLQYKFLPVLRKNFWLVPFSSNKPYELTLLSYLILNRARGVLFVRHPKLAVFLLKTKALFNMPVIFEAHEIFHYSAKNKKTAHILKAMEAFIYERSDGIIAISSFLRDEIREIFAVYKKPISVITNAVKDEQIGEVSISQKLTGEYLFYCGSFYPWKGVDIAIRALRYLPKERLLIVGGGKRAEELNRLAREEGVNHRVTFTGMVAQRDVAAYMSKAKVALIPNLPHSPSMHSSPLKMFEYMAAEVPIVASNLPGISEVLENQESAVLFEAGSVDGLVSALSLVLNNPAYATSIAKNAKILAQRYTYSQRAQLIVHFIKEVINK